MMKKIQRIGTLSILLIILTGFFIVISTKASFELKLRGHSNSIYDWFTQNAEIDRNWLNDYYGEYGKHDKKKSKYERIMAVIAGVEKNTEQYATGAFPKCGDIKQVADYYKNNILHNNMEVVIGGKTNLEYAEEATLEVKKFEKYLERKGIDFLYVQLPGQTRISSYSKEEEYPTEKLDRADKFSSQMKTARVPFLDINHYESELQQFSLDESWYWMPKDALAATRIVAERLNDEYGFTFDLSKYQIDEYYNALDITEDKKKKIFDDFGYEYNLLVPKFETNYYVDFSEYQTYYGSFLDTLLSPMDEWDKRVSDGNGNDDIVIAYHNMWTIENGAFVKIKNLEETNNQGKRILVLGDSFSWPVSSYLSEDVEELVAMHPGYFYGDVKTYMALYKPDIVIWMYLEGQCGADNDFYFSCVN